MPQFNHDQYLQLWARQLQKEFEDICWRHRISLPTPIIDIFDSTRHLGEWHAAHQTIRLSRQLILYHPWTVTINVLKHEMAHQLCSAYGHSEAGHGPLFQEACLRLGVPEAYCTARGDSPEIFADLASDSQLVQEGRRFFAKVEKLLALAHSENEHEAALAMQKANELIEKYNLQQMTAAHECRYAHAIINHHKKRIEGWQRSICSILKDFFYVTIIQASLYDPRSNQEHKTIELFGRAENVAVAEYCYHFLERELAYLWEVNKGRFSGRTATEKKSYYLGVLHGFHKKLQEQQTVKPVSNHNSSSAQPTSSALIVAADQDLGDFIGQRFPRLRTVQRAAAQINRSTYNHGASDGKNIILRKGVSRQDGNQGRLLSYE
ncbi:MAG: DUF2786 domain-containing protein [Desulfobulbaceae bacterium]|nr:DUF2786 domain-containing protein [Desulfobulbaceae bacterium]